MKKALSLLLALTLIFAMAAPASAAYTGRFSRDGTYNNVPYLISASCTLYMAKASVSYDNPTSSVSASLTIYLQNGTTESRRTRDTDGSCSGTYTFSTPIDEIYVGFTILGAQIAGATVSST